MDADLTVLLQAWLCGDLNDQNNFPSEIELRKLIDRLNSDESFRQAFVEEVSLLGQLRAVQSSEPRWLQLEDQLGLELDGETSQPDFESVVMQRLHRTNPPGDSPPFYRRAAAITLAVSAVFLGMYLLSHWSTDPKKQNNNLMSQRDLRQQDAGTVRKSAADATPRGNASKSAYPAASKPPRIQSVAVLSQAVDAHWGGDQQFEMGDSLQPGDFLLTQGTVQIEFLAGVRFLLRAPADIELRAPDEVLLRYGAASCFVTEMGRGFKIVTNEMEVVDLGTAFSIEVESGKQPEVHVLEGSVEISGPQSDTLEVTEHQAIRMGRDGPESVAYSPDRFPKTADLRNQQRREARRKYDQWLNSVEKISADPSVLLHYTFQERDPSALELVNRASDSSNATDGAIIGCQWDEGRWPGSGKRSLVYRNSSDRVLFQVPGTVDAATFLVWARIDALTQPITSLLMTEEPLRRTRLMPTDVKVYEDAQRRLAKSKIITVRWELAERIGQVMLSAGRGEKLSDYDIFSAKHPFTNSDRWGQWACLAVTCDVAKREVIHYLNGKPIGAGSFTHAEPLLLDFMELGNFGASGEEIKLSNGNAQRRFYGAFDQLVIANRVFSPDEIEDFWSSGKP